MGQRDTVSGQDRFTGFVEALEVLKVPRFPTQWSVLRIDGQSERSLRRVLFRVGEIHMTAEEFVEKVISLDDRDHYVIGLVKYVQGKRPEVVTERVNEY